MPATQPQAQGDKLLWLLGGAVALMGVAFFVFLNMGAPQSGAEPGNPVPVGEDAAQADTAALESTQSVDFSVRLNRARLAVDAGMFTEPEGYSAWSIYAAILDEDATNAAADQGLRLVAGRIIDAAFAALNGGRRDTAAELAELVLSRFDDHTEALEIIARARREVVARGPARDPAPALPPAPAVAQARANATARAPAVDPTPATAPEPVDPIVASYSEFTRALAAGLLREPAQASASTFVAAMRTTDPDHPMTLDASSQLFEAIFERHNQAFNELDTDAALQWLDAARELQTGTDRVAAARNQILDFVAAQAAAQSVPASELTLRNYVPPEYPSNALRRGLEGWVDVEFVVAADGRPTNIEATAESSSIFRPAATSAVGRWEFEPRTVHERVVEQQAHTRIRFVLED